MSALARYYRHEGYRVWGYDRTPSDLTRALEKEGIEVFYDDEPERIGEDASGLQVGLVHPASAGHGLNLQQGGHHIIWYGLTWSLELLSYSVSLQ